MDPDAGHAALPAAAWVLNLDAEDELAAWPRAYTPSRAMRARCAALRPRLAASPLFAPGDLALRDDGVADPDDATSSPPVLCADALAAAPRSHALAAYVGRAWCPTPRAVRAWARAGVRAPAVPPAAVLRAVNHRAFSAALGPTLPGACFVRDPDALARALASHPPSPTGRWLLKRPFGFAGRGRLRVRGPTPEPSARAWIDASFAAGDGLAVAPWVDREADFALHGYVARAGACTLGEPTVQQLDPAGAWIATHLAAPDTLASAERRALFDAAERVAGALAAAGYFGPFNLDAFRWRDARDARRFDPRCEVNARYAMGWAVGMADRRVDRVDHGFRAG